MSGKCVPTHAAESTMEKFIDYNMKRQPAVSRARVVVVDDMANQL